MHEVLPITAGCSATLVFLRCFLASPETEVWTLKAREEIRSHVEGEIRTAGAGLDVTTLRRSSHAVSSENSASYDRRLAQRRQDLADIALLKGTEDTVPSGTSDRAIGS